MSDSLGRLRVRLTAWYVAVFGGVLLMFGAALFVAVTRQVSAELDHSIEDAVREIERATRIRESEQVGARGAVVDALEELHIPGHALFVFDGRGRLVHPDSAPPWIAAAARAALDRGEAWSSHETGESGWRLYARRFETDSGETYVAAAAASSIEIEDRYRALIVLFALAGVASLALAAVGGTMLAHRSIRPVEQAFGQTRRFLADAAHELRTPLAVLRGGAEVALQREREREEYIEALERVSREAGRLGGIVEGMFQLARADAGEWPVRREQLYLDDVLQDAVEAGSILGRSRGVQVEFGELAEAQVDGDPDLLRQLFLILIDNAVQFTPSGGKVAASVTADGSGPRVSIEDTGPGIAADDLPRVFDRFWRADSARGRQAGAGLGLSIARWIADLHGATIAIDSAPGSGTRVRVLFSPTGRL